MSRFLKWTLSAILFFAYSQAYSSSLSGHFLLEAGGYYSSQGQSQTIYIENLIGDRFTVTKRHDYNFLLGLGYLLDGYRCNQWGVDFGINAFYLARTKVSGTIYQELIFPNLAFKYYVSHLPVYVFAKGYYDFNNCTGLTLDLGIGPNFMKVDMSSDKSLDGITLPDNAFKGTTSTTTFSGMAGVGLRFIVMNDIPLEIGYRFFWLGEGHLNPRTSAVLNKLKTGNNMAHALILTVSV